MIHTYQTEMLIFTLHKRAICTPAAAYGAIGNYYRRAAHGILYLVMVPYQLYGIRFRFPDNSHTDDEFVFVNFILYSIRKYFMHWLYKHIVCQSNKLEKPKDQHPKYDQYPRHNFFPELVMKPVTIKRIDHL